ncbi:protein phosphatase 2C domain-containing protein [Streptomyces sp. I4(2020)]|nr:protein phosphatase 2C domain-containing protein [Streptomyces sp. I4(2020)]MBJ6624334.1 protein phosphatase 2C domain-containing protein [Streptomyces sp. I4(2020)]
MSQQGGRPGGPTGPGPEDDWWGQLYDDASDDTGPAPAADSLDDRFASAAGAVGGDGAPAPSAPDPRDVPGPPVLPRPRRTSPPSPKAAPPDSGGAPPRAWWEPEPSTDTPPVSVPPERPGPADALPATEPSDVPAAPPEPPSTRPTGPAPKSPFGPEPSPGPASAPPQGTGRPADPPSAPEARLSPEPPWPPGSSPPGRTPPADASDASTAPKPPSGPESSPGPASAPPPGTGRPADSPSAPEAPLSPGPPAAPWPPGASPPGRTPPADASDASTGPKPPSGPESPPVSAPGPASAPPPGTGRPVVPPSVPEASPARHPATEPSQPDDRAAASEANPSAPDDPAPALPGRPPPSGPTAAPVYGDWTPAAPSDGEPADANPASRLGPLPPPLPSRVHVGTRPPTYDAEPTALPAADPDDLDALVPDTVLDGARYGACTLRAVSVRGDSARYRGEPRRDVLLTARFGSGERALVLVALATGTRTAPGAHLAAAEVCRWIAAAVGRSHERLAADIRAARRTDLKAGLHRLTDRVLGKLRAAATEQGLDPDDYAASMRCLLLSGDPECRTRVFFGVGPGGLFRLREREWQDIEPEVAEATGEPVLGFGSVPHETPDGDRLTMDLGIPTPPSPYEPAPGPPREPFRFRTSVARPGDVLLMCGTGFAEPLRGEPGLRTHLADRWSGPEPPGLTAYLADTQVRVKGYADDRTAVAVWEA